MSQHHAQLAGRSRRWVRLLAAALFLAGLTGCEEEQITKYDAPKDPPLPSWANDDRPRLRMLVAMIPHGSQVWFFKLLGPDAVVTPEAGNFEQFVQSIRFQDDARPPAVWRLPAGWLDKGPSEERQATIRIGSAERATQMTVSTLDSKAPGAGDALANARRWRQQMGYWGAALAPDALEHFIFEHSMPCGKVTIVDLVSMPIDDLASRGAPRTPVEPAPAESPLVQYKLPAGWQPSERRTPMAVVTLTAGPPNSGAMATISPLSGPAGGIMANVNRWRSQVGLEPIERAEIDKQAREILVDGKPALYFRIDGQAAAGGDKGGARSILAMVLVREDISWFVKLIGPTDVASAQEPVFIKFAESIRIADHDPAPGATP